LTIVQPGHAGKGTEFASESLSSIFSIWWTAFHKIEIDSNGTFARIAADFHRPISSASEIRAIRVIEVTGSAS